MSPERERGSSPPATGVGSDVEDARHYVRRDVRRPKGQHRCDAVPHAMAKRSARQQAHQQNVRAPGDVRRVADARCADLHHGRTQSCIR